MGVKLFAVTAASALIAVASAANAAQPRTLSDTEMDGVASGSSALANAAALALGEVTADTQTQTSTNINKAGPLPRIVIGQAFGASVAAGGFLFDAGGAVHVDTSVKW
jgi:hypothetical protein